MYALIKEYAIDVCGTDTFPTDSLQTARSVVAFLRSQNQYCSPEEIGTAIGIAPSTAKQIILALQNGGIDIRSGAIGKPHTGRSRLGYFLRR